MEITERQFLDRLNALPPEGWWNIGIYEVYCSPERIYADIVNWYCRINNRFFSLANARGLSGTDVVALCSPAYRAPAARVPEDVQ